MRSLEKVRPSMDVAAGHCQIEADAIQDSINNETEKGAWMDLFVRITFVQARSPLPSTFFSVANKVISSEVQT